MPPLEVQSGAVTTTNQAQLLDAYAAVDFHNFQLAVGRQSLSWAPGPDSMMWSDNIEPVNMIRLVNPEPFLLPGFLRHLGPVRVDQFFGRLDGRPYVPNPFVYGQKINVKLFSVFGNRIRTPNHDWRCWQRQPAHHGKFHPQFLGCGQSATRFRYRATLNPKWTGPFTFPKSGTT